MRDALKQFVEGIPCCDPKRLLPYTTLYLAWLQCDSRKKRVKNPRSDAVKERKVDVLTKNFLSTNQFLSSKSGKQMNGERSSLPIFRCYDSLMEGIASNTVTIVSGSTGCGKSTQLPQYILDDYMKKKVGNLPLRDSRVPFIVVAEVGE